MRALDPQDIVLMCKSLNLAGDVKVLEKADIPDLLKADTIIFSDDEVMRQVADIHLAGAPVVFEKAFLRWDKLASVTSHPVSPDIELSELDLDRQLIAKARQNAKRSSDWWRQVGAVIVKNGEPVFEGYNQHKPSEHGPYIDGDPRSNFNAGERPDIYTSIHGEAGLIARAAQKGISLEGSSIYVTTFPCPNCALLIIQAGIKHVYYADGYSNLNAQENLKLAGVKLVRVVEA